MRGGSGQSAFTASNWAHLGAAVEGWRLSKHLNPGQAAAIAGVAPDVWMIAESGHNFRVLDWRMQEEIKKIIDVVLAVSPPCRKGESLHTARAQSGDNPNGKKEENRQPDALQFAAGSSR